MILRELVTLIGFQVDAKPLNAYNVALQQVENTASGIIGSVQGAFNYLYSSISKVGLGTKLSFYGISAAGLTATAQVEKFQASFEVMLKSTDKAKTLMNELFQFESKTPFNLEQVITAANKLLIAKQPAETVTKQLQMLGDVAAGDAQRLQSIVYVLGQVRSLGYLQGQDIMQFTNALVPIRDAISKVTGKTGKDLQKLIEQRKITADMTQKALEIIAKERTGLMERQSKTLGGLWSSLMSALFRFRVAVGEAVKYAFSVDKIIINIIKILNWLTNGLNNLTNASKKLGAWMITFLNYSGPFISVVLFISKILFLSKFLLIAIKFLLGGIHYVILGLGLVGIKITLSMFIPILMKLVGILGAMLLKMLAISAVIIGLFVIIEDIAGFFTGKQSVIIPTIIKFFDWLKKKFLELTGMPEWVFDFLVEDTLKRIDDFFTAIIDRIVLWYYKLRAMIEKYGLLNIFLSSNPITAPLAGISKGGRALWGDIAGIAGKASAGAAQSAKSFAFPNGTQSPLYQNIINVNGMNFTVPEGTPQSQRDAIGAAAKKGTEEAINAAYRRDFVRQVKSATKDH